VARAWDAVGSVRWVRVVLPDRLAERLARCVVGLFCFGLGISCFIAADLGLAPWDVLHQGLSEHTGLSLGVWIEIIGAVILLGSWVLLGQRPGIGTVLNAIEIGVVVALVADHLPRTDHLAARLGYIAAGLAILGIGSGLYIGSGLGAGPRDGLMIGLHQRAGLSIRVSRTVIEAGALVLGLLLGGSVGIGTAAFVVAVGPVVHFCLPRLAMPATVVPRPGAWTPMPET
jgi:uncharacterized membrane protein YczE